MFGRQQFFSALFSILVIAARCGYFICTPLWLDFFKDNRTNSTNESSSLQYLDSSNSTHPVQTVSAYFVLFGMWVFSALVFGMSLLVIKIWFPSQLRGDVEGVYPKRQFVLAGCSCAVSGALSMFSLSGSRTAPYLVAILGNCIIPIQFVVRFFILGKRPSRIRICCAVAVVISEFICLIPTIFPQLESDTTHHEEGGDTGAGRFLWPLLFVVAMIPFAVGNSIIERGVQMDTSDTSRSSSPSQLNLIYFNFWYNVFGVTTLAALFWIGVIPGFGTSSSITEFGDTMWFNLRCLFGGVCPAAVVVLGWATFLSNVLGTVAFSGLMRFSEGASFVVIVLTLRSPILFIFWTLFQEDPFLWKPHAALSTWLSIGAIAIMIPAIIIYDRAPMETASRIIIDPLNDDESAGILSSTYVNGIVHSSDDEGIDHSIDADEVFANRSSLNFNSLVGANGVQ